MLGKLIKYELKATGRIMLPLYLVMLAATLALSANIRLTSDTASKGNFILSTILIILFVLAILAVSIISVLLILNRFYKNLLGDEGYLMFSLPVSTAQNITSKGLTALIWIICSILTGIVCGFVMVGIVGDLSEFLPQLKDIWSTYLSVFGKGKAILYLILFLVMIIVSMLEAVFKVYAAISVGHQWGNHRIVGSVLAYIAFSTIETILSLLFNLQDRSFYVNVSYAEQAASAQSSLPVELPEFSFLILIALIGLVVYGLISWLLLDRRLNLE